jgi:hypothetical protein
MRPASIRQPSLLLLLLLFDFDLPGFFLSHVILSAAKDISPPLPLPRGSWLQAMT